MTDPMTIPFFSPVAVNSAPGIRDAIQRVIESGWYILGREVASFETEFAAYNDVAHCVSVASGSDALELALRAVGVTAGAKVVTVANAGFYGSIAIHALEGTPLYVDVDDTSLTMSAVALEAALAVRPAAVIVTHLYGQMADMPVLSALCRKAGVPLIEDCAQAHGAAMAERKAGSWGDMACFSFYPTKNMGALGDAGAIVTSDDALAARLRALRQYGWSQKYTVAIPRGRNSRMDELQAAVLRVKLLQLDEHNGLRQRIAAKYNQGFLGLPLRCPALGEHYVGHLYVVRTSRRDALHEHLQAHGIGCDIHYPVADHMQPVYMRSEESLVVTQAACQEVLSLPCYPGLSDEAIDRVIYEVRRFFIGEKGCMC